MTAPFERPQARENKTLIDKYRPSLIGQGSENFIYIVPKPKRKRKKPKPESEPETKPESEPETKPESKPESKPGPNPEYRKVVIKVNKIQLAKSIHAERNQTPEENQEALKKTLEVSQKEYQLLRSVFGDHVLRQKQFATEIPYDPDMIKDMEMQASVYGLNLPPEGYGRASTIVTVQERSQIFDDKNRVSFDGGLLELQLAKRNTIDIPEERWKEYAAVTNSLMNGEQAKDSTVSQEALEKLFAGMGLAALLKKSSEDESFKRIVTEFQKKAVEHAKASGTIMDIIGKDNIVFIKKEDGNWDYKLADAIFPLESNVLEKAKEIISRVRPGQKLPFNERLIVRWAVGHVRQINALGKMLGTDAYIDLSEDKIPGTEITIAELVTARNEKSKVQETSNATGPVKKPGSLFRRVNGK